jgi:hypothetical protein
VGDSKPKVSQSEIEKLLRAKVKPRANFYQQSTSDDASV